MNFAATIDRIRYAFADLRELLAKATPRLLEHLLARPASWIRAPIPVAEHGRQANGDEIGAALHGSFAAVAIGERPGLSSPDSLGVSITWMPRSGRTDAERVCLSPNCAEGLGCAQAAELIEAAVSFARRRKFTGVAAGQAQPALAEGNPE